MARSFYFKKRNAYVLSQWSRQICTRKNIKIFPRSTRVLLRKQGVVRTKSPIGLQYGSRNQKNFKNEADTNRGDEKSEDEENGEGSEEGEEGSIGMEIKSRKRWEEANEEKQGRRKRQGNRRGKEKVWKRSLMPENNLKYDSDETEIDETFSEIQKEEIERKEDEVGPIRGFSKSSNSIDDEEYVGEDEEKYENVSFCENVEREHELDAFVEKEGEEKSEVSGRNMNDDDEYVEDLIFFDDKEEEESRKGNEVSNEDDGNSMGMESFQTPNDSSNWNPSPMKRKMERRERKKECEDSLSKSSIEPEVDSLSFHSSSVLSDLSSSPSMSLSRASSQSLSNIYSSAPSSSIDSSSKSSYTRDGLFDRKGKRERGHQKKSTHRNEDRKRKKISPSGRNSHEFASVDVFSFNF